MSSDIDEDSSEVYSAPRRGVHPVEEWSDGGMIHSYVNLVDRGEDEEKPALPARRDKQRNKSGSQRKPRSKDRDSERRDSERRETDGGEYERIKEREKELERIHRRSRELMMSPRLAECGSREGSLERSRRRGLEQGSRDGSLERSRKKVLEQHYRMSAGPQFNSTNQAHFNHPPPPCHPPPPLPTTNVHNRYKSPSPATQQDLSGKPGLRRRVQSPNRRDYKDFSAREFRSPHRTTSRLTDEEEDSGADSMNDFMSNHSCRSPLHSNHSSHLALVPYDPRSSCRTCYSMYPSTGYPGNHYCTACMYLPQNMQVALNPSVEDRLLALEGDKDQLHLQVAVLSDQLDSQTDKITDLERVLDNKKEMLRTTEEILQREIINRSSLETQKLELLSEISGLKLRQTSTEKENSELRRRLAKTLQLSDSGFDGTRSLPRRPTYRESSFNTIVPPQPSQPSVFRPVQMQNISRSKGGSSNSPTRGDTRSSFFSRSNSIRHSSVPSTRNRDPSTDRGTDTDQAPIATKPRGLKKILCKMRRANSGHIPQEPKQDFDKDQQRASAGSKIACGWEVQRTVGLLQPDLPFEQWSIDLLCSWFDNLGLYMYSNEVRRLVKDGAHLASMSSSDLENKLGIKHNLHKKKLMLAISSRLQVEDDPCSRLDHQWVTRWLDDVGLPQYKDSFLEARVDGRVLNYLTIDELFQLKVTNQLHHLSLKHGIDILRSNGFDPSCLKRRGIPGERESQIVHSDVVYWTNHRVMDWLRQVDLSEYAPNLRGSGVHGALLIQENRFTAELLASLLSIPTSKTLLRRHLCLHFKDLVGPDVIQDKREAETQPDFQPLTPNTRAKHVKKGQFTLKRKKSKNETDFEDLLCPIK